MPLVALEQELATYQKKLEEWSDREGKYVLIHESDVIDFFSAYDDALKAGYERFRLKPFLVKQVQAKRPMTTEQYNPPRSYLDEQ